MACEINKVLFIQFKFLGDTVFLTPVLQAYKKHFPEKELHILVSQEAAPLLSNLNYIDKVWAFPRTRGKINFLESIRFIHKLRSFKFDIAVDFEGNDRGSLITRFLRADVRVGAIRPSSTFFQKSAYSKHVNTCRFPSSYIISNKKIIEKALGFKFRGKLPLMQILPDLDILDSTLNSIPGKFIICHVSTTQEKKQWALDNWIDFYRLSEKCKIPLLFSAGPSDAEQFFLKQLKRRIPEANILKPINDIKIFIAFLSRASLLISNDSGPLHFAAAMKVKIIGLFGPADSVRRAAPIYDSDQKLIGKKCECINDLGRKHFCSIKSRCIDTIKPIDVFRLMKKRIKNPQSTTKPWI
jgi:ADP-heptose:LPS heptosyltransferase